MERFFYDIRLFVSRHRLGLLGLGLPLVLALALAVTVWSRCGLRGCPSLEGIQRVESRPEVVLVDRDGEHLTELHGDEAVPRTLDDLPPHVPLAFMAVEDKRFADHGGVDWLRVLGALWANLRRGEIEQGSSTLSMQLARNLFPERIPRQSRTLRRKFLETRVAQRIEDRFSKQEILELYLNHIPFGRGARGLDAASRRYFGHGADELTLPQAALLAALPKAPSHYDPLRHPERARQRRNLVLDLMEEQELVTRKQAEWARRTGLGLGPTEPSSPKRSLAPYFVDRVERELADVVSEQLGPRAQVGALRVVTTLDRSAQIAAREELDEQLGRIEKGVYGSFQGPTYRSEAAMPETSTDYLQGAVVVLDVRRGEVLAWVGGRDYLQSTFDRVTGAQRPVGSAFKPFVLATALSQGHYLSERVSDRPLTMTLDDGDVWSPSNFGDRYGYEVTLRNALVYSKNVAAVRVLQETGVDNVRAVARELGLPRDLPGVPALALGVASLSPLELTTAYVRFATGGEAVTPHTILRVEDGETGEVLWEPSPTPRPVLDPAVAYLVTDVLSDVVDRGTARAVRAAGYSGTAAGKTGTTNRRHDAWFVGYTPDLVSSVWIGFDQPRTILPGATGGGLAAPAWGRTMRRIYRDRQRPEPWRRPPGVVVARVDTASGFPLRRDCRFARSGSYRELFLWDSLPQRVCPEPRAWVGPPESGRDRSRRERSTLDISWSRPGEKFRAPGD